MSSKATFENAPELFPLGEPKPFVPQPLNLLGDNIIDHTLILSGGDLVLESQSGETSSVTLPTKTIERATVTTSLGSTESLRNFSNTTVQEILFDIDDWQFSSSDADLRLPNPENLEVGDIVTLIDYKGDFQRGGNTHKIRCLAGVSPAWTFDNPNNGIGWDFCLFYGNGRRHRFRVTSSNSYEMLD